MKRAALNESRNEALKIRLQELSQNQSKLKLLFIFLTISVAAAEVSISSFIMRDHKLIAVICAIFIVVMYAVVTGILWYGSRLLVIAEHELKSLEISGRKGLDNETRIQSLINNISDGVIAVDKNYKVIIYNAAALNVLDINTEIMGKKLGTILQPVNAEKHEVDIVNLLHETNVPTTNRDLLIKYTDGSFANLFLGISPIYLGFGKSENNGYTLLLRDITREKSLEEERNEFISVVSHELRTPIAISEGSVSNAQFIAAKTGDMEAIKKALNETHNQIIFLADMINDLSTLSRAERNKLELDVQPINIPALITELSESYSPQATTKGLELKTELDPSLTEFSSSKLYTREILQNFITNAIKYTESGSVTVSAKPGLDGINFAVADTGIGISKSDQDKVYDKFFRSEDFRTRQNSGTGLGLYVTMKLANLLHAEISLVSQIDKGSTFSIYLPDLTGLADLKATQKLDKK